MGVRWTGPDKAPPREPKPGSRARGVLELVVAGLVMFAACYLGLRFGVQR